MGSSVSTASPVNTEGLGSVLYDQGRQRVGCLHSQRGGKRVNQDAAVLCQGYGAEEGVLCGVFDGHGTNGHLVSRIVKEQLPLLLLNQLTALAEDTDHGTESPDSNRSESDLSIDSDVSSNRRFLEWEKACVNCFQEMDEAIKLFKKVDSSFSGTTAVVVLKQDDYLFVANLGDSRAILATKDENVVAAIQLTTDLKPGTPDEADRIRRSNGRVFALRDEPGLQRAWLPRVYSPGMAMSRSFGDLVMKNYGIVSIPVVTQHRITSDDLFVVLATDGVWDVLSNEEVVAIVYGAESEDIAAKAVVDAAITAWKTKTYDKPDDCTAVCFFLQNKNLMQDATTT